VNPPEILLLDRVAQRFIGSLSVRDRLEGGPQVKGNDEGIDIVELRPRAVGLGLVDGCPTALGHVSGGN
jgi:hypothetical protein